MLAAVEESVEMTENTEENTRKHFTTPKERRHWDCVSLVRKELFK
jgi:hypothetical protein